MLSSLVMNVVNIGGNAVLIYHFRMGVMGAALASLVSRMIACFAVIFLLEKPSVCSASTALPTSSPTSPHPPHPAGGHPAGIENGMFQIGKLSVSA